MYSPYSSTEKSASISKTRVIDVGKSSNRMLLDRLEPDTTYQVDIYSKKGINLKGMKRFHTRTKGHTRTSKSWKLNMIQFVLDQGQYDPNFVHVYSSPNIITVTFISPESIYLRWSYGESQPNLLYFKVRYQKMKNALNPFFETEVLASERMFTLENLEPGIFYIVEVRLIQIFYSCRWCTKYFI